MRPRPDAAENLPNLGRLLHRACRFNEAAARCRGKRRRRAAGAPGPNRASMRPRPDAAENGRHHQPLARPAGASMRPRPDAAENAVQRPQDLRARDDASMRPRPDAAENTQGKGRDGHCRRCFNEAAARCRGKRGAPPPPRSPDRSASMRPRPDAAENRQWPKPRTGDMRLQ